MAEQSPLPAAEIRDLVRRITEGVLADPVVTPTPDPSPDDGDRPPPAPGPSGAGEAARGIAIGADHGGYSLKEDLKNRLSVAGHRVVDCGTDSPHPVDYPDVAHAVARLVAEGSVGVGIVVDGAGIGSAIVANKVPGVRAALCYDLSTARNSREHNHANVLTLGAGLVGAALAWQIVEEWLSVPWGPDRHARRVAIIGDIERTYARTLERTGGAS